MACAARRAAQLCINFANEMLQQQFNADVFRQQQKEYDAEGVPWQHSEYQDTGPVLELIRGKRDGTAVPIGPAARRRAAAPCRLSLSARRHRRDKSSHRQSRIGRLAHAPHQRRHARATANAARLNRHATLCRRLS